MTAKTTTPAETRVYRVAGMTCAHCVASVQEEVGEVSGVTAVEVDVDSGRLIVTGAAIDENSVAAAVAEAGYELV